MGEAVSTGRAAGAGDQAERRAVHECGRQQVEAEILGCELNWSKDNPPAVISHPLEMGEKTLADPPSGATSNPHALNTVVPSGVSPKHHERAMELYQQGLKKSAFRE